MYPISYFGKLGRVFKWIYNGIAHIFELFIIGQAGKHLVLTRLQIYCDISYSMGGENQMWILENSKDLLEYIESRPLSSCNNIKTVDFSTLCTAILHTKLKYRLKELVQLCFLRKNDQRRHKYLVLGRDKSYFVNNHSDSVKKFSVDQLFQSLWFLS